MIDLSSPDPLRKKLPILLHHVAIVMCCGRGLYFGRMHIYACLDGCCEATLPFLMVLNLGRTKGGGVKEWSKRNLGLLWTLNGALLWLSFIIFRLLLFPAWLCSFFMDISKMETSDWANVSFFEFTAYPLIMGLLWCLSYGWFVRIHDGLVKPLRGPAETIILSSSRGEGADEADFQKDDVSDEVTRCFSVPCQSCRDSAKLLGLYVLFV